MNTETLTITQELEEHQKRLKDNFFGKLMSTTQVKIDTMKGDTARAYHKEKCYSNFTPTSIFKNWLHYDFLGDAKTVKALEEGQDFEALHAYALEKLRHFWKEKEKTIEGPEYYHFVKLIDLLFKSIARWDKLTPDRRKWFFDRVHVPLDQHSLLAFKQYTSKETIKALKLKSNPSIGDVAGDKHYGEIKKAIKELVKPFPPLLFDLFAWDHLRKQRQAIKVSFELIDVKKARR